MFHKLPVWRQRLVLKSTGQTIRTLSLLRCVLKSIADGGALDGPSCNYVGFNYSFHTCLMPSCLQARLLSFPLCLMKSPSLIFLLRFPGLRISSLSQLWLTSSLRNAHFTTRARRQKIHRRHLLSTSSFLMLRPLTMSTSTTLSSILKRAPLSLFRGVLSGSPC